jgi:peptide/nickel transport system substrate-binding protein
VVVPEGTRRIEMVERGDMDATALTNLWNSKALDDALARSGGPARLAVEDDTGDAEKMTVMFNTTKPPLDDVRIRRAIAQATDIPAIAARNGWPLDSLAQGPVSPSSPFFSPAPYPAHDPGRAKALIHDYLTDPKVPNRPREIAFTLMAPSDDAEFVNQLVDQWAQVGIKAKVSTVEFKQTVRLAVFGGFDAMILRYFASADFDLLWHFFVDDTLATSGVSINFARMRSREITDGMNEARATPDVEIRKRAYARVQQAFAEQMPYLWMQRAEWRLASNPRVHDAHSVSLPDGRPARALVAGTLRLTETWVD